MPGYFHPPHGDVVDVVARALAEDLSPLGDMTSGMLDPAITATAHRTCSVVTEPRSVRARNLAPSPRLSAMSTA